MRRVICYNQGEYTQYSFLAGELHKTLKDFWRESPSDVDNLHKLCDKLMSFLNGNLHRVSQKNFQFIKECFSDRHEVAPRICIKANFQKDGKDGEDYIVQLIRDKKVNYLSQYRLESNSGFLYVKDSGIYFLCNEIPKKSATEEYYNARINTKLAQAYYKQRNQDPTTLSDKQGFTFDESWIKCWNPPILGSDVPFLRYAKGRKVSSPTHRRRLMP